LRSPRKREFLFKNGHGRRTLKNLIPKPGKTTA